MSQHDFTVDNQGFPAFRADMNSALQALISNSAGASEPSTMFAYQLWYDSTNNILKMRNAGNDAWINIYEFDQDYDTAEVPSANLPAATTSLVGGLETSTDTEAKAVSATNKIITPSNLAAVFAEPPAIGGTTAAAGTFTTLVSNSGNISANGFKFYRHFASTLAYNGEYQVGVISNYAGSVFLISAWDNAGSGSYNVTGLAATGYSGATLNLATVGSITISNSINWGSPPSGVLLVGREASGNKLVVMNRFSGITLQVRVLRII